MKRPITLFFACIYLFALCSCYSNISKRMVEDKQSVGVLMLRPAKPTVGSAGLQFTGGVVTSYSIPVKDSLKNRVAGYDNNTKTSKAFGKQIVDGIKSRGVDAHLLESFPTHESALAGSDSKLITGQYIFSAERYPTERKKYNRYLVVMESLTAGASEGPLGLELSAAVIVRGELYDSVTDEKLGRLGIMELTGSSSVSLSGSIDTPLDNASKIGRSSFLTKVIYN